MLPTTWLQDKQASDNMDHMLRLMGLKGVVRQAVRLLRGVHIQHTDESVQLQVFSVLGWFKVKLRACCVDMSMCVRMCARTLWVWVWVVGSRVLTCSYVGRDTCGVQAGKEGGFEVQPLSLLALHPGLVHVPDLYRERTAISSAITLGRASFLCCADETFTQNYFVLC